MATFEYLKLTVSKLSKHGILSPAVFCIWFGESSHHCQVQLQRQFWFGLGFLGGLFVLNDLNAVIQRTFDHLAHWKIEPLLSSFSSE